MKSKVLKSHEGPTVLPNQISELTETKQSFSPVTQADINESRSKGLGQSPLDVEKREGYIRCLSCGSLISWASSVCENCLADPFKDRRANTRLSYRIAFIHDDLLGKVHNISRGGVQIKTRSSLPVGEQRTIAFSLGNGILAFDGIVLYAQILSGRSFLAGVKFTNLSDKSSGFLNRFLDSHLSKMLPNKNKSPWHLNYLTPDRASR